MSGGDPGIFLESTICITLFVVVAVILFVLPLLPVIGRFRKKVGEAEEQT
jgi:TctA family transporter